MTRSISPHAQEVAAKVLIAVALFLPAANHAVAQGNIVMGLDPLIVNDISGNGQPSWGGFSAFHFGSTIGGAADLGRYGAFTLNEPGAGGSGLGINFTLGNPSIDSPRDSGGFDISPVTANMFPLLDRGTFGASFDPSQYVAELTYKPLAGNTATALAMTVDSTDGFIGGNRAGEQWQWRFSDLVNKYSAGSKDADGFVKVPIDGGALTQAAAFFHGNSFLYAVGTPTGDNVPDFNNFEGNPLKVPNGVVQIQLQTAFGAGQELVDNWEVKSLVIRKLSPDPREMARLDARSGLSVRFGTAFSASGPINVNGTNYFPSNTDQVSRFDQNGFTNLVLKTQDDSSASGIALWQPASAVVFNGTNATVDIRAKLTVPPGADQANHIVLVVKDKDGNDTNGAGDFGGDEYHYNLPLGMFNTSTMTTVSVPLAAFTKLQAFEFQHPGDGLLSNFNLYYLGINTDPGVGQVNMEIESVRVMLPVPEPRTIVMLLLGATGILFGRRWFA